MPANTFNATERMTAFLSLDGQVISRRAGYLLKTAWEYNRLNNLNAGMVAMFLDCGYNLAYLTLKELKSTPIIKEQANGTYTGFMSFQEYSNLCKALQLEQKIKTEQELGTGEQKNEKNIQSNVLDKSN